MLLSSRRQLSLYARCHQLEPRKGNLPSCVSWQLYFYTHALVCLLEANGFTIQQAEIIVLGLVKIMETNMDFICKVMVSKMQQEIALHQIISKIANMKKDMIILEKSKFSALRAENEKIKLELHQLKQQVMYSLNEKKMLELRSEIVSLHAQQDRALTQTDRKIETEVAGLKTMLEAHKLDTIEY